MTAEAYLQIYKKIWATIRHDIWKEIEDKKRELRVPNLNKQQVQEINNNIHDKFDEIRSEIYATVLGEPDITDA